ncbi:hypothetical protein Tco_0969738 [Tanacetum coccineum]
MEIFLESTSNSSAVGWSSQNQRIHIKMEMETHHSSRVEFTTTCSCSNYKDILLASRFKNQESSNSKTKTFANSDIQDLPSRYQVYQGRLLASFQDDAKYEHVGQDTRSQGGKDDQDKQGKDLKISELKTKSKDNDKGSRSKITQHEGTSLQRRQRLRPQDLNDKSNLIDLMKECHNKLTSGEIVSLKILSQTIKFVHYEY